MKYIDAKNCKWANADKTLLDCEVNFEHLPEEYVPFTADINHEIFTRVLNGDFGDIEEYVEPNIDINAVRRSEIIIRISQIESEKLRPLSDLLTPELFMSEEIEYSKNKLVALQQELIDLRAELSNLI